MAVFATESACRVPISAWTPANTASAAAVPLVLPARAPLADPLAAPAVPPASDANKIPLSPCGPWIPWSPLSPLSPFGPETCGILTEINVSFFRPIFRVCVAAFHSNVFTSFKSKSARVPSWAVFFVSISVNLVSFAIFSVSFSAVHFLKLSKLSKGLLVGYAFIKYPSASVVIKHPSMR